MTQSPCINICKMDDITGLCTGCFRTLAEITAWSRTDDMTRASILVSVNERRQGLSKQAAKLITGEAM